MDPAAPVGWSIQYGIQSETPNDASTPANVQIVNGAMLFEIDVNSPPTAQPSIASKLRIVIRNWS